MHKVDNHSKRSNVTLQRVIRVKRAYAPVSASDGYRVLVDRIWPRGASKKDLKIDHWLKDIAPSASLRQWFNHDLRKWEEFRTRYAAELDQKPDVVALLLSREERCLTLVFAAHDTQHNNAVVLAEYLERTSL